MQFHWGPALACKQGQLSALREPVDAAEVEFAFWIVERLGKTKWGVGKIQIAVGLEYQVIRTVDPLPLIFLDENCLSSILFETADATIPVLAEYEASLLIKREAIRSRLPPLERLGAGIAGGFQLMFTSGF